jgi:hypothetical protein
VDVIVNNLMEHLYPPILHKLVLRMDRVVAKGWKDSLKAALAIDACDRPAEFQTAYKKVFKKRTRADLVGSGALVRSKKKPTPSNLKNKVDVVVYEGRTPLTIFALQNVLAHILGFLGPKMVKGLPVKDAHDNIAACTRSEFFFRWSKGSFREYENTGHVESFEEFLSEREAELVEQLEK